MIPRVVRRGARTREGGLGWGDWIGLDWIGTWWPVGMVSAAGCQVRNPQLLGVTLKWAEIGFLCSPIVQIVRIVHCLFMALPGPPSLTISLCPLPLSSLR